MFAEMMMKSSTPMISDVEIGLNLSESYSRELVKFINETFTTHDFEFNNNSIVRSVKLFNEDNRRFVDITINDSVNIINSCKRVSIVEYVNDTIKFNTEFEYTSLNEMKESLRSITHEYKCKSDVSES